MNLGELEKLSGMVRTSPILSPQERAEWLALLELMNDKQLLELEKILGEGVVNRQEGIGNRGQGSQFRQGSGAQVGLNYSLLNGKDSGNRPSTPNRTNRTDTTDRTNIGNSPMMPKLSHIVNLPRVEPGVPKYKIQNTKYQTNGFGLKLKQMFREKELPVGKPSEPLELSAATPAPQKPQTVVHPLPPPIPKPKPAPAAKVEPKPLPKPPTEEFSRLNRQVSDLLNGEKVSSSTATTVLPLKPQAEILPKFDRQQKTEKEEPLPKPQAPEALAVKPVEVPEKSPETPTLSQDVNIRDLNELGALKTSVLKLYEFQALVKNIRSLIAKFGYHETVFALEKSPLYRAYIRTGSEALNGKSDFEDVYESGDWDNRLNRQQFEEMADLLRQIQAG